MQKIIDTLPRKNYIDFKKHGVGVSLQFFGWVWEKEKWVSLTGSATILTIKMGKQQYKILIDFWMFQGCQKELKYNEILPFDISKLDVAFVTHTHVDHIWKLLFLSKDEFNWTIWTTKVSKQLLWPMLKDVIKLQPKNENTNKNKLMRKVNNLKSLLDKVSWKENQDDLLSVIEEIEKELECVEDEEKKYFDIHDLNKLIQKVNWIDYNQVVEILPWITLKFISAGHLPGSAQAILTINWKNNKKIVLWFSGDLGKYKNPSLWWRPEIPKEKFDLYMIESTYAGRFHNDFEKEKNDLVKVLNETISKNGKIIIPVFVQGRAQELMVLLSELIKNWDIPKIPIYVHSETIEQITSIVKRNFWLKISKNLFKRAISGSWKNKRNLFDKYKKSAILICSGGMMDWWTIRNYLDYLQNSNALFISMGYQWEWTLGGQIFVDKVKEILVPELGKVKINAKIYSFRGFSGHADQADIIKFVKQLKFKKDSKLVINHWEKTPEQYLLGCEIKQILDATSSVLFAAFNESFYEK